MKLKLMVAMIALSAGAAQAVTLTFEGQANTIYNAPIVRSGYEIGNVAGDEQHFHEVDSTQYGLTSNGTGILLDDRLTRLYMTRQDSASFSLGNFDAAWYTGAGTVTVEGWLGGIQVGSFSFGVDSSGWKTLSGLSLGSVDRIVFDGRVGQPNGMQFDNINVGAVPEPESYALMLAGLVGVAAAMRRRVGAKA